MNFRTTLTDERGKVVGFVDAKLEAAHELNEACRSSLVRLSRATRGAVSTRLVYRVKRSHLDPALRGTGLGVDLYVHAVEDASAEGYALMADSCVALTASGRRTSEAALRAWASRRFQAAVLVDGLVAAARPTI